MAVHAAAPTISVLSGQPPSRCTRTAPSPAARPRRASGPHHLPPTGSPHPPPALHLAPECPSPALAVCPVSHPARRASLLKPDPRPHRHFSVTALGRLLGSPLRCAENTGPRRGVQAGGGNRLSLSWPVQAPRKAWLGVGVTAPAVLLSWPPSLRSPARTPISPWRPESARRPGHTPPSGHAVPVPSTEGPPLGSFTPTLQKPPASHPAKRLLDSWYPPGVGGRAHGGQGHGRQPQTRRFGSQPGRRWVLWSCTSHPVAGRRGAGGLACRTGVTVGAQRANTRRPAPGLACGPPREPQQLSLAVVVGAVRCAPP